MPRPGHLTPRKKTSYQLHKWLGGPQGQSEWVQKILPQLGFHPQTVQLAVVTILTALSGSTLDESNSGHHDLINVSIKCNAANNA